MHAFVPVPRAVGSLLLLTFSAQGAAAQTAVNYPKPLGETVKVVNRLEAFLDGTGDFDWAKLPGTVEAAQSEVETYLADHPDDVGALLLKARVGRVVNMLRPTVIGSREGGGLEMDTVDHFAPLQEALDRAITIDPGLAEAYFWKARLYAIQRLQVIDGEPVIQADWDRALEPARQAVALAPEEDRYRVVLGLCLAQQGDITGALDVLRGVEKGKHVLFRILDDFQHIPVPESARSWPRMAEASAEMFAGAPGGLRAFAPQRVRAYLVPITPEELEAYYREHWPDFQFIPDENDPAVLGQYLEPKGNGFVPSKTLKAIQGQRNPDKGIMFVVNRRSGLNEEQRSHYPPGFDPPGEFCELTLVNFRQK